VAFNIVISSHDLACYRNTLIVLDRSPLTMGKYRDLNSMPPAATYRNGINALMNYLTIAPSKLPPGYPLQQLDE
jgi:hypothetical protein